MGEVYYNSGQFQNTLEYLEKFFPDAFSIYERLGSFYMEKGYGDVSHTRMRRYEILLEFLEDMPEISVDQVKDQMVYDLYLRENLKSRPGFARDQKPFERQIWDFRKREKVAKNAHVEVCADGTVLLFDYAKKLGAENTHFTVPDGYHDNDHYTTASDMLKLAIAATQSSTICDITCQPLAIVYDEEGGVHSWDNGNILLTDTTIPYEVYGFKTGFTDEAGFCFIGYAGMNDKKIITLTYGCEVENRFADTKKLMDLGFDIYDENHDYYSVAEY